VTPLKPISHKTHGLHGTDVMSVYDRISGRTRPRENVWGRMRPYVQPYIKSTPRVFTYVFKRSPYDQYGLSTNYTWSSTVRHGYKPYNMFISTIYYSKNLTTKKVLTIGHMPMFVVKSIVIQINGLTYGSINTRTSYPVYNWVYRMGTVCPTVFCVR